MIYKLLIYFLYKYNYHYDTTGLEGYEDQFASGYKFANVFKVTNDFDQTLDAVSIAAYKPNSEFKIEIYTKDSIMDDPTHGATKKLTQNVSFEVFLQFH